MATREENLKKINNDLEKLDDEQLEKISGGQIDNPNNPKVRIDTIYDDKPHLKIQNSIL